MRKSLYVTIVIFIMGILLLGCSNYDIKRIDKVSHYNQIEHHVIEKDKGINLTVEASYKNGQMTIVLDNNGLKKLHFGTGYVLEKQKNDKWYQTKYTYNKAFNDIGIKLKSGKKHTQKAELKMPDGHYRVIKQLSSSSHGSYDIVIGDTFTVSE
ncbi:hypothetical protein GCM10008983_03730 [Lentibacillus halophilus]|uniref:Bacterial Ig-like domain-containing protein n=1 Tax=Lentibacillus halophilus TaxID=295065 RepID=A0ABN0Z3B6_9BACI